MESDSRQDIDEPVTVERLAQLARSLPKKEAFELLEKHWVLIWESKEDFGLTLLHSGLQRALAPRKPSRPAKPEEDDLPVILKMRKEGSGSPYWNEVRSTVTDEKWKSYLFWGKAKGWFPQDAE